MASYSVQYSKSATTGGAGTVDTITLSACRVGCIEIINRGATNPISFRIGNTGSSAPADPSALGDDAYVVAPNTSVRVAWALEKAVVKVVAGAAQAYTVQSVPGMN